MGHTTAYFFIIVFALILLFVISFSMFIRRILINSSIRANNSNAIAKKLDKLIEQNEKIVSLLEKKD
ncbi:MULTISPECIES: DUF4083 family protein [Sutcliffiella]|uniref:DUF4083 domain-containing protein n=1 Tax=Sutcliffiella cohnii TaxID=33932 RepID=A0A223KKL9_9BACI|nr:MULTISPECIES: DUF4083 family protein [Sutcliffiella]AST90030.1 hypothetical protein BC6307_01390 [Sutcliffiella cohnii]WBL15657.1 DUF4083 family protein [Sutcliffiella sp. NC1]